MNGSNPHREALELLQRGPILGRGAWLCDGLLCTQAIYAKACLGWSDQQLSDRPSLIAERLRFEYGSDVLMPLARILLDMFADQVPLLMHTEVGIGNAGSIIVHLNDQLAAFTQAALELAVEKAAIQWDEQV